MEARGKPAGSLQSDMDAPPLNVNLYRTRRCGELRAEDVGRVVQLAGWVAAKRDHGGLLFIDLRDPSGVGPGGLVQLVAHPDQPAFAVLDDLRLESVVTISGQVVARPPETVNPKLATGQVEIAVETAEVLSSADILPFSVERDTEVGEENRLRYRYLDMRRGPLAERITRRAQLATLVRTHLAGRGFLEVQTPVLTASSPEGARDYLVPSSQHPGEFYALPQAPQQFKQLLMVGGIERYFQIAPCFRDEASRADRSPGEFYQIDLEMAFATQDDVFHEVELLMTAIAEGLSSKTTSAPFPRLTFTEAVDRFGSDKPDLRFGLELADLTADLGGRTELPMFADAPEHGHVIRALRVPGAADRSRKWFDGFADEAKKAGVIGTWLQLDPAGTKGPLARRLTKDEVAVIVKAVAGEPGDAILVSVGPRLKASTLLGDHRRRNGRELGMADPDQLAFAWVVDFPMFERDEVTGAWDFAHNPFSMPQGGLEALTGQDPGDVLAYQYDLVCNGVELSSGAVRNHRPDIMEAAFAIAGYGPDRIRSSFPALWNAFHYGPPPHAGIAPGFDRILMVLEDQANIREVIAFPLNQSARDLLMGAPAPVTDAQLRDVHLKVVPPAP
jgi:aspartyl-tRNA synthetase